MAKGLQKDKHPSIKVVQMSVIGLLLVAVATMLVLVIGRLQTSSEANGMDKNAATQLVVYEGPKTLREATPEDLKATAENLRDFSLLKSSDTFVSVNDEPLFVYETNVNHTRSWVGSYLPPISRTPITYFDFEGRVVIEVTVPNQELSEVTISPLSYGIEPVIDTENKTIRFEVTTPDNYTITFDGSPARALHIFANALETDMPDFDDEQVIYIGPGEWDIENIMLESGQTLYLSGGAVVHGIVQGNFAHDIKVMGRGIIDGAHLETWGGETAFVPLKFDYCNNITIKDVIVLNANA